MIPNINRIATAAFLLAALPLLWGCRGGDGSVEAHDEHEHEHGHGDVSEVELTDEQMKAVGITLGFPESRQLSQTLNVSGVLAVDPRYEAVASPKVAGTVERICVTEGQRVGAGAVIAYVSSPEIPLLRQEYQASAAEEQAARKEYERQQALASQGAGIRKNLDAAASALSVASIRIEGVKGRMAQYGVVPAGTSASVPVKAEISGTVTALLTTTGGFADMQSPVAKIVDNSRIYCMLKVYEKDLGQIRKGADVEMRITNDPSVTFSGKVVDINPVLEPDTKTAPVKVSVDMAGREGLIPGMGISASVSTGGTEAMALPEEAVVASGGKSYIFVLEKTATEGGEKVYHFEKREVITGASSMGYVEITPLAPLEAGDKVVTSNAFFLNSMATDHGEHNH